MALIKAHTLPSTIEVTYWRLAPVFEVNVDTKTVEGVISGYTSAQAREDGAAPAVTKRYLVTIDNVNGDIREQIYTKLPTTPLGFADLQTPFFADAISDE